MGKVMQPAQAGTLESNDISIIVAPAEPGSGIVVDLDSIVLAQYGDSIRNIIITTVQRSGVTDVLIKALDKGALDCTIEARTLAALARAGVKAEEGSS